ncbi:MAG: class II aldolase/adducin family protein [Burkholderiales bacterium]|jgi:L-fuculose-phosphate aldolase|nr:class II aldolase/adducin family protein [Burkholderiales bacterium]
MTSTVQEILQAVCDASREMVAQGLNRGASGNLSVRCAEGFWVTPSGVDSTDLYPEQMVLMSLAGEVLRGRRPSSEWRFHRDIYVARPEFNAVVHAHSPFATSLSCLREEIPPFHYMIAMAGGDTIRCADYALFGTQALSDAVLQAMTNRKACIMANHGMIAAGDSLKAAMGLAVEVESLSEQYWRVRQLGRPVLLSAQEMNEVMLQFQGYGRNAEKNTNHD